MVGMTLSPSLNYLLNIDNLVRPKDARLIKNLLFSKTFQKLISYC